MMETASPPDRMLKEHILRYPAGPDTLKRRAMKNRVPPLFVLPLILLLPACSLLRPQPVPQELPSVPSSWSSATEAETRQPPLPFPDSFDDPALAALIEEAIGNNFDLRAAAARVRAARANAAIGGADRAPQIAASLNASRAKRATVVGGTVISGISNYFQSGVEIRWEADLWGRLGHQARAATLELAATEADYRAARLSLAANIARRWFNLIEARRQLELTRRTVADSRRVLESITAGYRSGISSPAELEQARSNLANAESRLTVRQERLTREKLLLQTLLGRYPAPSMKPPATLPELKTPIPAGLPADLLTRRPDLLAAEHRLRAADERLRQAAKNRLPRIQLTASGGTSSDELQDLLDGDRLIWSLVGGLTAPLFQGGRLKANQALARANAEQAMNQYAQTLLEAFREVEGALSTAPLLAARERALAEAVAAAERGARQARDQYRAGLGTAQAWLEARQRLYNAQSALLEVKNLRLQNRIDLHLALGGDFASTPATERPLARR